MATYTMETARFGAWGRDMTDGALLKLDRPYDHKRWEVAEMQAGSWRYYGSRVRLDEIEVDLTEVERAACAAADAVERAF